MSKTIQNNPKQSKTHIFPHQTHLSESHFRMLRFQLSFAVPPGCCGGRDWGWSGGEANDQRGEGAIRQTRGQPRMANALKCRRKTMNMWVIWSWYFLHIRLFSLTLFFIRLYLKQVLLRKTPQSSVQSCIPIIDVSPLSRRYAQPWYEEVFFMFFPYSWMNLSPAVNKCEQYRWRHAKKPRSS